MFERRDVFLKESDLQKLLNQILNHTFSAWDSDSKEIYPARCSW